MLLAMDDAALPIEISPIYDTFGPSIASIFGNTPPSDEELRAQWELLSRNDGQTILPRTIRYIEERRVHEGRWIAALRDHPSPITVVWGERDPIAVYPMAERFVSERPGTPLVRLDGVGHFPMIEAPGRLYDAIEAGAQELDVVEGDVEAFDLIAELAREQVDEVPEHEHRILARQRCDDVRRTMIGSGSPCGRGLERDGAGLEPADAPDHRRRLRARDLPGAPDLAGADPDTKVRQEARRSNALAKVQHHLHRTSESTTLRQGSEEVRGCADT